VLPPVVPDALVEVPVDGQTTRPSPTPTSTAITTTKVARVATNPDRLFDVGGCGPTDPGPGYGQAAYGGGGVPAPEALHPLHPPA
jgi:hypothetical protein